MASRCNADDRRAQQVRAQAKWVRMSARKARLVLDHVRGRTVPEARTVLAFTPRAAAREIDRVLASAVANAESAHGLDGDELVVLEAYADEGPTLKRWRARARAAASTGSASAPATSRSSSPEEPTTTAKPTRRSRRSRSRAEAPQPEAAGPARGEAEAPQARPKKEGAAV